MLFTDGVVDTMGESERFGYHRLEQALLGCIDPPEVVRSVDEALSLFDRGSRRDDVALLAVKRR